MSDKNRTLRIRIEKLLVAIMSVLLILTLVTTISFTCPRKERKRQLLRPLKLKKQKVRMLKRRRKPPGEKKNLPRKAMIRVQKKKLLRKVMQLRPKRRRQMKSWMTHQAILWIQDSEDRLRSLRSLQIHISLSPAPQARSSSKSIPSESSHWARSRC